MKRTCLSPVVFPNVSPVSSFWVVTLTSSSNNTKFVLSKGEFCMFTVSMGRVSGCSGYNKREEMSVYKMARNFVRHARGRFCLTDVRLGLSIRGFSSSAIRGLIDGGLRFHWVNEINNPPFNGCRNKKRRRR